MDAYHFVFKSADQAQRFVMRCAHYMTDIAILRHSDTEIEVIDGADKPQRERIYSMARTSDAVFAIPVPRREV